MNIKHPEITVKLIGGDGNAFAIIGAVCAALKVTTITSCGRAWNGSTWSNAMLTFIELLRIKFQCAWLRSEIEYVQRQIAALDNPTR